MERRVEHGGVVPPAGLGAVAVVGVDVDDGHPVDAAPPQTSGRHRGVVQVAAAAEERRARRGARAGGRSRTPPARRRARGRPRSPAASVAALAPSHVPGPDRRHGVHGVATELGADRRGRPGGVAAVTPGDGGEPVGDRVRRARVVQVAVGHPALVRGPQQRPGTRRRGRPPAPPGRGPRAGAIGAPGGAAGLEEHVGPLGQLVVLDRHAAPHAGVDAVGVGGRRPDDRHAQLPHRAARYREPTGHRDLARLRRTAARPDPRPEAPLGGRLGTVRRMPAPTPAPGPGTWASRSACCRRGRATPSPTCRASSSATPPSGGRSPIRRRGAGSPAPASPPSSPGPVSEVVRNGRAGRRGRAQRRGRAHLGDPGAGVGRARDADPAHVHDAGGAGLGRASSSCWPSSSRRSAGTW